MRVLASEVEGRPLLGDADVVLGTVTRLLYHPSASRVVGAMVRPPAALVVVERPETFLPLAQLRFEADGAHADLKKLPSTRKGAEALGFNPDTTIIWTGMPVCGPSGRGVGVVGDVEFDPSGGAISRVEVAGGVVADAAHGRYVVSAASIGGYSEGAIRIAEEAGALETSGGLAKTAARAAVVASATAAAVGQAASDTVVAASGATGRAIRAASEAEVVKKAAKRVRHTWRDTVKAFRDGMDGDD